MAVSVDLLLSLPNQDMTDAGRARNMARYMATASRRYSSSPSGTPAQTQKCCLYTGPENHTQEQHRGRPERIGSCKHRGVEHSYMITPERTP
jgi:hypothetical protein